MSYQPYPKPSSWWRKKMLATDYDIRYICPACKTIVRRASYGPKSDLMRMIKYMVSPPFCINCTSKTATMDVLDIKCKTVRQSPLEDSYRTSWKCDKCFSIWMSVTKTNSPRELGTLIKPKCIKANCDATKDDIRLIRIQKIQD